VPGTKAPVSAVIVCQNEQDLIGECLDSLEFCAEIVIVDSGSTDGTLEIIEKYRADGYPIRLLHHAWQGFAPQKEFALLQATAAWCLMVDADERVDRELRGSIVAIATDPAPAINGWEIRRRDWLAGYGYAHPRVLHNRILRLFRNGKVSVDPDSTIHETFLVDGPVGTIKKGLLLHRRALSLADDIVRANAYSTQKAKVRRGQGVRPSIIRITLTPPYTFFKFYVLKRYFLCGIPGFIYAMTMMIYSFLTEAKLYSSSLDGKA
jgi:glycosyltransferase involved in cell wall biosynthesis